MYSGINSERPQVKLTDTKPLSEPSVRTPRYSEAKLDKTERRQETRGELGAIYEKKILMLGLYKALKNGYDFKLDTNIKGVGALDDVVFIYKENDGIEQQIYLQSKHNEKQYKKITYEDFLKSGKDDYALYKYFIDYKKTIENVEENSNKKIKYFIIYTTIDLHCTGIDGKGLRMHKKSEDEKFIFKKLDLFNNRPLEIFSTMDSNNSKKYPAFYQFSDKNENDDDEKSRVINVLKNKFKAINKENNDPKLTTSEKALDNMLEGYINILVFAVDQYDHKMLSNQIKEEIKQDHQYSLTKDQVDFIFEYALNQICQWKNCPYIEPLTEKDDFFKIGKNKLANFRALYPVLVYENELGALNIRFFREKYRELNKFISSGKQLWLIFSKTSWLDSLVIYQALNEENLKEETGINYANHDHHLLLTGRDLLKGYQFVLPTFQAMGQSLLIIACEPTDVVEPKSFEVVNEIVEIVSASKSSLKQVIVIAPENHKLSMQLKQKLTSSYYQEHEKIEFPHLTQESQETCLAAQKILFKGNSELFSIQQLLGLEEEYPLTEQTLAKLNLDSSELETLLKSPIVEIGNEQPLLSHLGSAYYKTHTHIKLEQLEHTLKANSGDIFAFVGNEDEIKASFPSDQQQALIRFEDELPPITEGFILLSTDEEEKQFKQLCHQLDKVHIEKEVDASATQPALHLLKKWSKGWLWTRTYRKHYMKRHFYPLIVSKDKMKKDLLTESFSSDFIVFSGINEEILLESLCINDAPEKDYFKKSTSVFPEESDAEKEFERLSNNSTRKENSIHWLKVTDKESQIQLQWHLSEGKINWIRSVLEKDKLDKSKLNSMEEKSLVKSKARFIILADEPGMGKSTTLVHVTDLMKQEKLFFWVMKIDLNRHQRLLDTSKVKTLEDLVGILLVINDKKIIEPLTSRILMHQLTCPGKVALLWDGFDEVKSERQDAVLEFLNFLKKETAATIWVTTRRHDQEKLEECLSILAHPFEPLDKAKQIGFLSRFWETALKLTDIKRDLSILESYAKEVIQRFEQSIQVYQGDQPFISIPLRAWMLAEVYQEAVKKMLEDNNYCKDCFEDGKQIAIGTLYQQFIARKYEIYLQEKVIIGGLDEESKKWLMKGYTKAYTLLAMQKLFGKRETAHFMGDKNNEFSLNILSRIGLIEGNEEPVNFIHRTFAEYFAGKWLAEHTENLKVKTFLGVQLFKKESVVVRCIFDHFLTQNLLLHRAVLHGNELAFKESSYRNFDIEITDVIGRTPLHLAAQEGRSEMISLYLLRTGDNTLIRDQLGRTPLHYAAGFGHENAVIELLEKQDVDIDLDYHILKTPLHFDSEIGSSIFNHSDCVKSNFVKLVNEQDELGKSPLYYAADNGHWNTACILLSYGADSSVLMAEHKGQVFLFACLYIDSMPIPKANGIYTWKNNHLFPVVGFLCSQVSEAVLSDVDGYQHMLSYFFQYGHTKVIDTLLRSMEKEERKVSIANKLINSYLPFKGISLITSNDANKFVFSDTDYLKIVRYFYEQGRELGITFDETVKAFLESAAEHGFLETYRYLYEYEVNEENVFLPTRAGDKKNIRSLFSNIQDLNYNNEWLKNLILYSHENFGWTRLHLAAMNKNVKSIEEFLNPSTYNNINTKDTDGYTPLAYASFIPGRSNFIESLFVSLRKLDLNDRNQVYEIINAQNNINGMAPLHEVIHNQDYYSAETLLKNIEAVSFSQEQLFNIMNSRNFNGLIPTFYIQRPSIAQLLFEYIRRFNFTPQQRIEILKGSNYSLSMTICDDFGEDASTFIEDLPLNGDKRDAIVNMHFVRKC